MNVVVADTGPINYLIVIDLVSLLPKLAEQVYLPASVLNELRAEGAPPQVRDWSRPTPDWIRIASPTAPPTDHDPRLSAADWEAIALAKELDALLLIDDRLARQTASSAGVHTIGTIGILEAAAAKDLIALPEAFNRLKQTTMFVSPELLEQALERDRRRHAP